MPLDAPSLLSSPEPNIAQLAAKSCRCLFLGWKDLLRADLIDQVLTTDVTEMGALLVIGQIGADALCHHRDERAIVHVEPIGPADEPVIAIANERVVEIDCQVGLIELC